MFSFNREIICVPPPSLPHPPANSAFREGLGVSGEGSLQMRFVAFPRLPKTPPGLPKTPPGLPESSPSLAESWRGVARRSSIFRGGWKY
jgi:hypothetical protein